MIFVMAATGGVGEGTVTALPRQGVDPSRIVAGGRNTAKLTALAEAGVQTRQANYQDRRGMEAAFAGVETLVLIPTKTPAAPRCVEHANALAAAQTAGVKRVVFLSIQAATPLSLFNVAPFILFAESTIRQSGLKWVIARMSLYTDPLAEWAPELARTGRLPYPVKAARIAYVTRADVSGSLAAIARQTDLHGEIVQLTGPAALSMPEVARALSDATRADIRFSSISDTEYRELCRKDSLPEEITDILVTMYHAAEAQEFAAVTGDVEALTGAPPESVSQAFSRLISV